MAVDVFPDATQALPMPLTIGLGGTNATTIPQARTNLGLGSIATLNSPLPVANGGTNGTDAATARTNLGLGTLAVQDANNVNISGGRVSIGGHASMGVLDVQGSIPASDNNVVYTCARLWPVAPAGAATSHGVLVEQRTGAASATAQIVGFTVLDQAVTSGQVNAIQTFISAGANRYNLNISGQAPNYLNGNLGIKQANITYELDVFGHFRLSGNIGLGMNPSSGNKIEMLYDNNAAGLVIQPIAESASRLAVYFRNAAGGNCGTITTTSSTTSYNTTSDRRLKRNIEPLANGLSVVRQLRPVQFRWREDDSEGHGFVADEVAQVVPGVATGAPDAVDVNGNIMPQGLDPGKLMPWVIGALQEVAARLDALEGAIL